MYIVQLQIVHFIPFYITNVLYKLYIVRYTLVLV